MNKGDLIAVYGSLRKGYHNNVVLRNCNMLCKGEVKGFGMYSLGGYPAITPQGKHTDVLVEVYKIDTAGTAKRLDRLEGFPNYYTRKLVKVATKTGWVTAWVYYMKEALDKNRFIESGDWKEYLINLDLEKVDA